MQESPGVLVWVYILTGIWVTWAHEFLKTEQKHLKIFSFHCKFTSKEEKGTQYQTIFNDMNLNYIGQKKY